MELVAEFSDETNYTVWAEIERQIMSLLPMLRAGYNQYAGFAKFAQVSFMAHRSAHA